MSDDVVCPICTREYELPRRFLVRADDIEFLPVPRKLGCLHTCCQSCLEEMWQKSNVEHGISLRSTMKTGTVCCPQCQQEQVIDKGVQYLPLDAVALSDIIPLNGTNLSFCSRCHDEVPSYSWCGACSVTLCEFHHQDHKLSINTSRHEVMTFKDITHKHVVIEPRMPPISCPQEIEQDATLFCQDCEYLLSPKAMMSTEHKQHRYCEASSMVNQSVAAVEENMLLLEDRERGLINAMQTISDNVSVVNKEMANSLHDIEVIFAKIHEDLEHREHALLQRLHDISNGKISILNGQLKDMEDALEKCRHALSVAGDLLEKSAESVVKGGGVYVVGLSASISSRCSDLDELIVNIPFEPQVDPFIRASFVREEIDSVLSVLMSLGSILTKDNTPALDNLEGRSPSSGDGDEEDDQEARAEEMQRKGESSGGRGIVDKKGRRTFSALAKGSSALSPRGAPFTVSFTIRTEDPPPLSKINKSAFCKEAVVVEARVLFTTAKEGCVDESVPKSLDGLYGEVVGEVVLLTEIDKRYSKRHIVRSNYESFVGENGGKPVLRLTREVVSCG